MAKRKNPSDIPAPLVPREQELSAILGDLVAKGVVADASFAQPGLALVEMAGLIQSVTELHFRLLGLSQGRFSVLQVLFAVPDKPWTPAILAESLNVTRGTMTDLLRVLERDGWVRRQASREDGRVAHVSLTETGRTRFARVMPQHFRRMAEVFAPLPAQDQRSVRQFANRVGSLFATYGESLRKKESG